MGSVLSSQSTPAPDSHSKLLPSPSQPSQSSSDSVVKTPQPAIVNEPAPQASPISTPGQPRTPAVTGSRPTAPVKEKRVWYQPLIRQTPTQKAKKSALAVHSLITGSQSAAFPKARNAKALKKLKTELLEPKTANRIIRELRKLPTAGGDLSKEPDQAHSAAEAAPIHAVCLRQCDAKADELYFSKFAAGDSNTPEGNVDIASMLLDTMSVGRFAEWLEEINVVDLLTAPDLGLGQPGDGAGILAGAVPTAETVLNGIEQITPQLMALGFAAGKAILPDHTGVFPPTDRLSVLTYWWGLEVLLPPPTLGYLSQTQSITGAVMNFLTALSLVVGGVREILPLARYISQFIDFEFSQIKKQDHGKGVVCAATWILPAALVPRPWDFQDRPPPSTNPAQAEEEPNSSAEAKDDRGNSADAKDDHHNSPENEDDRGDPSR